MSGKRTISRASRQTVWSRDVVCHYCRRRPLPEHQTLDHVWPQVLGGRSSQDNLVAACFDCNIAKADRTFVCSCDFCDAANRSHQGAQVRRRGTTVAAVAGYVWTSDGWKAYA